MPTRLAAALLLPLILAGCSSSPPDVPPDIARQIDTLADAGDCEALQTVFDAADTTGDSDRMAYVDDALRDAGCY